MLKDNIAAVITLMAETEGRVLIFDATVEEVRAELTKQGWPLTNDSHGHPVHTPPTNTFGDWISVHVEDSATEVAWGHW